MLFVYTYELSYQLFYMIKNEVNEVEGENKIYWDGVKSEELLEEEKWSGRLDKPIYTFPEKLMK